jgi:hypothetical protein
MWEMEHAPARSARRRTTRLPRRCCMREKCCASCVPNCRRVHACGVSAGACTWRARATAERKDLRLRSIPSAPHLPLSPTPLALPTRSTTRSTPLCEIALDLAQHGIAVRVRAAAIAGSKLIPIKAILDVLSVGTSFAATLAAVAKPVHLCSGVQGLGVRVYTECCAWGVLADHRLQLQIQLAHPFTPHTSHPIHACISPVP